MLTPYLMLVLAGYAAFMAILGIYWVRNFVDDLKAARDAKP